VSAPSPKIEPTLIEYGVAAFAVLFLATLGGQVPTYLWSEWNAPTDGSWLGGPWYELPSPAGALRWAGLEAAPLVALLFLDRRGTPPGMLLGAALVLSIATALLSVAAWCLQSIWDEGSGASIDIERAFRQLLTVSDTTGILGIAVGDFLATRRRARLAVGLAYAVPTIPFWVVSVLRAGPRGERLAVALDGAVAVVVVAVLLPLAFRLVPRAFERFGLHVREEPAA
jgi:hypothetical protein